MTTGAALTDTQAQALYNRLNTYLTAVGGAFGEVVDYCVRKALGWVARP